MRKQDPLWKLLDDVSPTIEHPVGPAALALAADAHGRTEITDITEGAADGLEQLFHEIAAKKNPEMVQHEGESPQPNASGGHAPHADEDLYSATGIPLSPHPQQVPDLGISDSVLVGVPVMAILIAKNAAGLWESGRDWLASHSGHAGQNKAGEVASPDPASDPDDLIPPGVRKEAEEPDPHPGITYHGF